MIGDRQGRRMVLAHHDDMTTALPSDVPTQCLESLHNCGGWDARELRHDLQRDLDLLRLDRQRQAALGAHGEAFGDSILDIGQRLVSILALGDASWNCRARGDPDPVFFAINSYAELHGLFRVMVDAE